MNLWTRRLMGALPIIGAGAGLTVLVTAAASVEQWNALMIAIIIGFVLFYLMGAVAGVLLLEGHRYAVTLNFFFWALQIPQLITPVITYLVWAPTNLGFWWNATASKVGLSYQIGSAFQLRFFSEDADVAVAMNVFALSCCIYLFMLYRKHYSTVKAD